MASFLADNSLFVLFLVIGVGAIVGSVRVWGVALGPAAALFAGLAIGGISAKVANTPALVQLQSFGLVLFTYTVGLASGPMFVAGLRRNGGRVVAAAFALVGVLTLLCAGIGSLLGFDAGERAGLFAGATTNIPALQSAIDAIGSRPGIANPVVACSLIYPVAIIAMIVVQGILLGPAEGHLPVERVERPEEQPASSWTVRITRRDMPTLGELLDFNGSRLTFSRYEHAGRVDVATGDVVLRPGDLVVAVGPQATVEAFTTWAGEHSTRHLPLDRSLLDFRRMVVSNRKLAGRRIGDLDIASTHGAVITRVRRGDNDLVATPDTLLQLGDRVRVVAPVSRLAAVAKVLGDSDRSLSEVDARGFALGIAMGMLLAAVKLHLPGGTVFTLGPGGGPLVVGLVLGVVSRTGPITWQAPQAANLTLRQLGVLMFLACAGLRSGATFRSSVLTGRGLEFAISGTVLAFVFAALIGLVFTLLLRRDSVEAAGAIAGIETQPAALAFGADRTRGNERLAAAYALVFPVSMVAKIVLVQFLV